MEPEPVRVLTSLEPIDIHLMKHTLRHRKTAKKKAVAGPRASQTSARDRSKDIFLFGEGFAKVAHTYQQINGPIHHIMLANMSNSYTCIMLVLRQIQARGTFGRRVLDRVTVKSSDAQYEGTVSGIEPRK